MPNTPVFSLHIAAGNTTSDNSVVRVGKMSIVQTNGLFGRSLPIASRYTSTFGSEWPGLVVRINIARILSAANALNISMVLSPGRDGMVPALLPHSCSISARCSGFATLRPYGRMWHSVPVSRTPPHAFGWPVNENGVAPGLPICPVIRCRLWIRLLAQTPVTRWLSPIVQKLVVGPWQNRRAASRIVSAGTPAISSARSGVKLSSRNFL